jgi:hypothetical protein
VSHQPITLAFSWQLPPTATEDVRSILHQMRQSVGGQGGELIHLVGSACADDRHLTKRYIMLDTCDLLVWPSEALFFPSGKETFGLAAYPTQVEVKGEMFDTGLSGWSWASVLRTSDLSATRALMHQAAECGIEVVQNLAGMAITANLGDDGKVHYQQQWALQPDEFL